jgi:hypothetical protein
LASNTESASAIASAARLLGWVVFWFLGVDVIPALEFLCARDAPVMRVQVVVGGELGQDVIQFHRISLRIVAKAGHGWRCLDGGH